MKNIKAKHVLVLVLVLISALILTVEAYAVGMSVGSGATGGSDGTIPSENGVTDGITGDTKRDNSGYGDVTNRNGATGGNGIVGDDRAGDSTLGDESTGGRSGTLGGEAESLMNDVGDAVSGEGGMNWVSVLVALALGGALIAVVLALVPKKKT